MERLDYKGVINIIKSDNHEKIMQLISTYSTINRMPSTADRIFIERGNHEEIMAYIDKAQFWSSGVKALFKRNEKSEVFAYLKWDLNRNEEKILLSRGDTIEIKRYLLTHLFKGENLVTLVKRNQSREIELAIDKASLGADAEECMLDTCSTDTVMYYLKKYPLFSYKQEYKLLMRGNSKEINFYKSKYGFRKE